MGRRPGPEEERQAHGAGLPAPPNEEARKALLKMYVGRAPVVQVDWDEVASATDGFSSADICTLVDKVRAMKREVESGRKGREEGVSPQNGLLTEDFLEVIRKGEAGSSLRARCLELFNEAISRPAIGEEYPALIKDAERYAKASKEGRDEETDVM